MIGTGLSGRGLSLQSVTEDGALVLAGLAGPTPRTKRRATFPRAALQAGAVFNRMWTLLHVPCINLPCHVGPAGLPIGVTLVSPRFTDRQLLRVATAFAPILDPSEARRC